MQGKQLDPIPLLLPLNLLLLVPFGHLLEKVKTKVLERWCALPLSLLYSFSAAAVTASWQLHTVNRFMKAMCIQALPSTLLSCQEQNNLGNVYSSRSIHIVYVYSSPCVHIHHVYLSSTLKKNVWTQGGGRQSQPMWKRNTVGENERSAQSVITQLWGRGIWENTSDLCTRRTQWPMWSQNQVERPDSTDLYFVFVLKLSSIDIELWERCT